RLGALITATVLLVACSPFGPPAPADLVVSLDVPFYEQQRGDDCAAAALASLLAFAGTPVPPARIDKAVYDPRLGGTLLADMENYSRSLGVDPRSGRGSVQTLREIVREGRPVVIPVDLGWSVWRRPHYVVIFGYGENFFAAHAGTRANVRIAADELERRWRRMGRLYLYLDG
ncbi:MAG: hypothetical protein GWO11_04640, partial [Desulfuromonadales bacterium]|nr:hypothetical protein [Desulfuromonadales bacterium]NIR33702.1 hypothetical protein [Desulfuromonadales bacterium]NIS44024.1 hypothetical protein [Desulfuromonadales bacterium]